MDTFRDSFLSQASLHRGHKKTWVGETCLHRAVSFAASPPHSLSFVFAGVRKPSSQAAAGPTRECHAMRAVTKVTPFTHVSPADVGPRLPPHRVPILSHPLILCLKVLVATGVRLLPSKSRGPPNTGGKCFEVACIHPIVSTTTSRTRHTPITSAMTFFVYEIASAL